MRLLQVRVVAVAAMIAFAGVTASSAQDAATLYKGKCQVCHGADGKGDTAMGKKLEIKDFHAPEVAKLSDGELFDITKKGRTKCRRTTEG